MKSFHFRDQIMTMANEGKHEIVDKMATFPSALEADDIKDFCALAQYYASKTPQSFRRVSIMRLKLIYMF